MLEGKNVNLRLTEKEDVPLYSEWFNNPEIIGEFEWFPQVSRAERGKRYDALTSDTKMIFIEKKDGTKIGYVIHFLNGTLLEIGYALVPNERGFKWMEEFSTLLRRATQLCRICIRSITSRVQCLW